MKALKSSQQRYVDVFKKLNFSFDIDQPVDRVKLSLNEHTKAVVGLDHLRWVGIAPFAQHQAKMYPADLMRELISALGAKPQLKVLLFGGGEQEKKLLAQLAKEIPGTVISVVGALSFSEELALISRLDLMVSMDSANGHLAANYGVPVITLWGGTHPYAGFSPLHQQTENQFIPDLTKFPKLPTSIYGNKQIEGYTEVMRSIDPTKIIQRIDTLLEL